jgi:hypothetical protein
MAWSGRYEPKYVSLGIEPVTGFHLKARGGAWLKHGGSAARQVTASLFQVVDFEDQLEGNLLARARRPRHLHFARDPRRERVDGKANAARIQFDPVWVRGLRGERKPESLMIKLRQAFHIFCEQDGTKQRGYGHEASVAGDARPGEECEG